MKQELALLATSLSSSFASSYKNEEDMSGVVMRGKVPIFAPRFGLAAHPGGWLFSIG